MELVNAKTLKDLEFHKVKEEIARHCASSLGRIEIERLIPNTDQEKIEREHQLVREMRNALGETKIQIGPMEDLEPILRHSREVTSLSGEEFLAILSTISSGRELSETLRDLDGEYPALKRLAQRVQIFRELEGSIRRTFDEDGEMREDASLRLRQLHKQKRIYEERVEARLKSFLQGSQYAKMIQENVITRRSSRLVIPIKSAYKHDLDCVVHDSSDSGQTLYIEPRSVVEANNEIRELESEIRDERIRIMRALTEKVQQETNGIRETQKALGRLDGIFGRARYAKERNCHFPKINQSGKVVLKNARHPLIDPKVVVPIDLSFGETQIGVLVTGPNTGGKTVALKTLGVQALMAQSGLPLPSDPGTEFPIFDQIRSDIGDEQSIQQNLSTFSSHMKNIVGILEDAGENSLVLIDEIGAGTDPQEGAALGMSIIRTLLEKRAHLMITTHFSALKHFAYEHEQLKTCSVEFDVQTLKPTYRLLEGVGASNALIIAERLGLPQDVITGAQGQMADGTVKTEEIIRMLERDRILLENEKKRVTKELRDAIGERQRFEYRLSELEKGKEKDMNREIRELERKLRETRRELEQALHKSRQGSEEEIKTTLKKLDEAEKDFGQAAERVVTRERESIEFDDLQVGQSVYVMPLDKTAIVREIKDVNLIEIDIKGLRIKTKLADLRTTTELEEAQQSSGEAPKFQRRETYSHEFSPKSPGIELHVRGMKVIEALQQVDQYLDRLVLSGMDRAFIVHGKGTGALRREIREKLKNDIRVKNYYSALAEEGGEGITIVEL